ncbi:hypothetical protein K461DRAFT_242827 [Myriangium duriaei CBS 260.36]|uniref:Ribophorin II C-terminal domain-containing protein n=1 Tax=Myriangium duriaei CBS 260.36 TaxID=1168546 RepID=A0A9P4J454_9PEZI|nr:hypothetical protein K461DRAFT_242827 [Myriangium duriaei CBS 260.36]
MRCSISKLISLSALAVSTVSAAWRFQDGSVSIQTKGAGVGSGQKETLSSNSERSKVLSLGVADTLKIVLTTLDGSTPKRPHQAFLTLRQQEKELEESFPLSVKDNGKAKVELTQKDLPFQFLTSSKPIEVKIVLASFGSTGPLVQPVFKLDVPRDSASPISIPEPPQRYGKLEEIHHIFRADPQSPPVVISGFFTLLIIGTVPVLLAGWVLLGANFTHLNKALNGAPVSHALFFGSIVAMEGVFFLYYTTWNLFQTLPVAGLLGVVAIVSGSRALTEVQERRLAGER